MYYVNTETIDLVSTDYKAHQIWWEDGKADDRCKIDTNGCPYIILGYDVRECQHGPDRNIKKKIQYKAEKEEKSKTDHSYVMKGRTLIQNTKKMICPARITQRRIIKFPGYRLENSSSKWRRKQTAKTLRKALEESSADVVKEEEIHMYYSTADDHKNHIIGEFAGLCQPVGPEVKAKIRQLVGDGVTKVSEMKRHLKVFVKKELEIEDQTIPSRRFYPTDKDIRNHVDTTKNKFRFSKDDQTNLEHLVQGWTKTFPDDNFYLRTCVQ
ncbi:calcium-responsive transcription factor-like [Mytilus edulis]|uniref:calcium-responsive transcription factor-like n=1 Tax=Mytilus edulis TaxID=6550 RepID=UPI0039EE461E